MPNTPLYNIPLLDSSTFSVYESNNHYRIIEALLNPVVLSVENTPPISPVVGSWYQVGTTPTGDFISNTNKLATWITDYWFFVDPTNSKAQFISPINTLYNPSLFVAPHTFYSTTSSSTSQSLNLTAYYKTIQIDTQHSGLAVQFPSLPLFKGDLTIINNGSFSLSAFSVAITANSSRTFFSDGTNIF